MNLAVKIGSLTFTNPIWIASGVCRTGKELQGFLNFKNVGALVAKTITLEPRDGNPPPRVVETPSGLLNSIGLENKGVDYFKDVYYPVLRKLKTRVIVSVAGSEKKTIIKCVEKLIQDIEPDAIELNLSCPNVSCRNARYSLIAQDPRATEKIVLDVRKKTKCVIIVKLSPNVTDIRVIASAAESGGADAVSLINTYSAMAVDAEAMKPLLGNMVGGLSGPAIKPMALKAVWDVYNSVKIPVVGMGGIMTGIDVAEFMLCGAGAVEICTACFVDPDRYNKILEEFKAYLARKKINELKDLIGKLKTFQK